ncbi:MAG: hypothetical protein IJ111_01315 [Eggerthellaceae bacterium]|nr:hypothetical protein [Eggerthellaceae bacterium]
MKKYRVVVDYVTTVDVIVDARDEESAENKVVRYIETVRGAENAVDNMAYNPEGLEVVFVEEDSGRRDSAYIEI